MFSGIGVGIENGTSIIVWVGEIAFLSEVSAFPDIKSVACSDEISQR